jgi:TonB family protein
VGEVRKRIGELLTQNAGPAPAIQDSLHEEFRQGRLDKPSYDALINEIERYISEEADTEWSTEQTPGNAVGLTAVPLLDDHPTNPHGVPEPAHDDAPGEPPAALEPGATLRDRFVLVSRIDAGSMGEIYKAVDLRRKEAGAKEPWVAIKIISTPFARYPHALKALQQEAANAQRLAHPNVVRVFDFDRHGDHFYITMELLEGESLVRTLDRQRFEGSQLEKGLGIIEGVAAGLAHAHSRGVIHADVKPGNVFVTRDGQAKLLDFGIARATEEVDDDSESSIVGAHTPAYASCEVLEGQEPTFKDDLFSLACLAYRIIGGHRAFPGSTALKAESKGCEPEPLSELGPDRWEVLRRAMAFRRADRPADVASFIEAFFRPTADMPAVHRSVVDEPVTVVWSMFQRPRATLWLGGACVLALGIWLVQMQLSTPSDFPGANALTPPFGQQEPVVRASNPSTVGPSPDELVAGPAPAEPSQPDGDALATAEANALALRVAALARSANERMDRGSLIEPADASAKFYLQELRGLDADAAESIAVADRLTGLIIMKAALAVSAGDFKSAERWLAEAEELDAGEEIIAGLRADIADARATAAARQRSLAAAAREQALAAATAPPPVARRPAPSPAAPTATATVVSAAGDERVEPAQSSAARPTTEPVPDSGSAPAADASASPVAATNAPDAADDASLSEAGLVALSELEFSKFIEPSFPRRLANRGKSGWVAVSFRVDLFGKTRDIEVVESEPQGLFEPAAVKAVEKWRFEPSLEDGLPVERRTQVKLVFEPS